MRSPTSRVDHSLDSNPLNHRDPTGDRAIRNLMPGQYQITHESGLRFWIDSDSLRPLLQQCEAVTARRSGRTHLHLKKKAFDILQDAEREDQNHTKGKDL